MRVAAKLPKERCPALVSVIKVIGAANEPGPSRLPRRNPHRNNNVAKFRWHVESNVAPVSKQRTNKPDGILRGASRMVSDGEGKAAADQATGQ